MAVKVALDLADSEKRRREHGEESRTLAGFGGLVLGGMDASRYKGYELFYGLKAGRLAGIHVLDAAAKDTMGGIGFRPDLNYKVALHLAIRIG